MVPSKPRGPNRSNRRNFSTNDRAHQCQNISTKSSASSTSISRDSPRPQEYIKKSDPDTMESRGSSVQQTIQVSERVQKSDHRRISSDDDRTVKRPRIESQTVRSSSRNDGTLSTKPDLLPNSSDDELLPDALPVASTDLLAGPEAHWDTGVSGLPDVPMGSTDVLSSEDEFDDSWEIMSYISVSETLWGQHRRSRQSSPVHEGSGPGSLRFLNDVGSQLEQRNLSQYPTSPRAAVTREVAQVYSADWQSKTPGRNSKGLATNQQADPLLQHSITRGYGNALNLAKHRTPRGPTGKNPNVHATNHHTFSDSARSLPGLESLPAKAPTLAVKTPLKAPSKPALRKAVASGAGPPARDTGNTVKAPLSDGSANKAPARFGVSMKANRQVSNITGNKKGRQQR